MSDTPPKLTPEQERRNKLFGRIMIVALGLLVAVYLAPMFLSLMK